MLGEEEKAQRDRNPGSKDDDDPDDHGDVALRIEDALLARLEQARDLVHRFAVEDAVSLALRVQA